MMEKQKPLKEDQEMDFEIQFYEGILAHKRDFVQALMAVGDLYTRKGLYEKGLEIDKKLAQVRPDDPVILYNLACSYSLVNQIDNAYEVMKSAIQCGYDDFLFLEQDNDLKNLLNDSRFQEYFSRIKSQTSPLKENEQKSS